jgi:hypothetical protein
MRILELVRFAMFLSGWFPRSVQRRSQRPCGWLCPCDAYNHPTAKEFKK